MVRVAVLTVLFCFSLPAQEPLTYCSKSLVGAGNPPSKDRFKIYKTVVEEILRSASDPLSQLTQLEEHDYFLLPPTAEPHQETYRQVLLTLKKNLFPDAHKERVREGLHRVTQSVLAAVRGNPFETRPEIRESSLRRIAHGSLGVFTTEAALSPNGNEVLYTNNGNGDLATLYHDAFARRGSSLRMKRIKRYQGTTSSQSFSPVWIATGSGFFYETPTKGVRVLGGKEQTFFHYKRGNPVSPTGKYILDRVVGRRIRLRHPPFVEEIKDARAIGSWVGDRTLLVLRQTRWGIKTYRNRTWVSLPLPKGSISSTTRSPLPSVYSTSAYRNGRTLVFVSFAIAGLPHRFEIHEFNREGKWVAVHAHLDARDFPGLGSVSALSPDGETLALISGNSKIFFFSLSSGTWERLTLERPADLSSQQCIAFTPDGKGILVAERDGELAWYE